MHKTYDKGCFIVDDTRIIPVVAAFPSQSSILSLATKRKVFFVSAFFFWKMDLQSSSLTWPSPSFRKDLIPSSEHVRKKGFYLRYRLDKNKTTQSRGGGDRD